MESEKFLNQVIESWGITIMDRFSKGKPLKRKIKL